MSPLTSEAKFTLTLEYAKSLVDPLAQSDWAPLMGVIDPDVRWRIASETNDLKKMTGVFNLSTWMEQISGPLVKRLVNDAPPQFTVQYLQTVGNRLIMEAYGQAVQKNGNPYQNTYAWFFTFSEETGKVVEIHEYLDTALVQEVVQTNTL
ncbi:hypothetical protein FB45DRAFT_1025337 [Roridomyces roridus]|uniref:SnoaL-like domain-containing protein n=1 Tax=Roridomyces roridus TaxID=1738132 RepID=A0AAD7FNL1_9AGAR|nr:hypothetical protein FB45DRAFT_1025337 [Roridomyces roridus]